MKLQKITLALSILLIIGCSSLKNDFPKKISKITENNIKSETLKNGWYYTSEKENVFKRTDKKGNKYYINPKPILIIENFKSSEEFENYQGSKGISVYFDDFGKTEWEKATDIATGSNLIFILNNEIFSSPYVNGKITAGVCAFWKQEYNEKQWNELREILK